MIVSHRHGYIFVKTKKTAGTSIELALSRLAGHDDVITGGLTDEDEQLRQGLGGRPPQNLVIPAYRWGPKEIARRLAGRRPRRFYTHMPAERIRRSVGQRTWNRYTSFAFIRNPWDLAVSAFSWSTRDEPEWTFSEWLATPGKLAEYDNWPIYTIDDEIAVDRVFRYEDLDVVWPSLASHLGFSEVPELPRAKASYRPGGKDYRDWYGRSDRELVVEAYQREIKAFGWRFG